jgi:sugar lactone lactonase YvrE
MSISGQVHDRTTLHLNHHLPAFNTRHWEAIQQRRLHVKIQPSRMTFIGGGRTIYMTMENAHFAFLYFPASA